MDYVAMYPETFDAVKRYSPEDRCYLYEAIGAYAFTGEEPSWPDGDIKWFVWESLRQRIEACKRISESRRIAGGKGGRARQAEANESKPKQTQANESKANPDTDTESDIDTDSKRKVKKEKRFVKPTVEEVEAFIREHSYPVDAQRFVDFYESKGWRVGNQPMRDWQAAVRTWARNDRGGSQQKKTVFAQQYEQRDYSQQEPEPIPEWMTARWEQMQKKEGTA